MKPYKKNLLLEQILNKPKLNIDIDKKNDMKYATPFPNHKVTVFVIFTDGIIIKHEHIIQSWMNYESQEYIFLTENECYIYRRELVRSVIERKE